MQDAGTEQVLNKHTSMKSIKKQTNKPDHNYLHSLALGSLCKGYPPEIKDIYGSFFSFFKDFIYLFMRDTETEIERQGEAGSMQGARRETRSRVSKITPWTKGSAKPLSHPGCPPVPFLIEVLYTTDKRSKDLFHGSFEK